MIITQTLFSAALAALAAATPLRRARSNSTTCYFIMTPTSDVGAVALQTSISYGTSTIAS